MNAYDDNKKAVGLLNKAMEVTAERAALRQILIVDPKNRAEITDLATSLDPEYQTQLSYADIDAMLASLSFIKEYQFGGRDKLTELAMDLSLCPLHMIDWAICFDDQTPECSQIRQIFPNSHDT